MAACVDNKPVYNNQKSSTGIQEGKINLTAKEANSLIQANLLNPEFIIVDIRTPKEYVDGHIAKAINIDFYDKDFIRNLQNLDKEKTYFFYCRSGNRTGQATSIFKTLNLNRYYILTSGINDWYSNNFTVVR
ncbi:MAG: hypothetical protein A2Y40_10325 [Candidatus Margulisbacteria bacterium GWF2_35_9]|nr:MAG: hypothetical protein A2Y40_10325 [Candidatus Margulisbacteria bacterium GWF2_35_9]